MTRPFAMAAALGIVGVAVLTSDASAQIRGPARRAAAGAAAVAGAPGVGARIEAREAARGVTPGDRWRYVNQGNQWWYYTPQNNWMYYNNNAWAPYNAATYTGAGAPVSPLAPIGYGASPDSWRYVYNGNRWWYYTPQTSWMVHNGNQWMAYPNRGADSRYQTGYRGNYGDYQQFGAPPQVPMDPNAVNSPNGAVQGRAPAALPNDAQPRQGDPRPQLPPQQPNERTDPNQAPAIPNAGNPGAAPIAPDAPALPNNPRPQSP